MVKLAKKGSQDPSDASLQMKVNSDLKSDQTIPRNGSKSTN